jgi:hypothetical protein
LGGELLEEDIWRLVKETLRLAAGDARPREIVAKATEAKKAIWALVGQLQHAINALDGIVPLRAPGLPWVAGWMPPPDGLEPRLVYAPSAGPVGAPASERARRVMDIANSIVATGAKILSTKEIADQLRREGDKARALETAVGNVLSRSGAFQRIRSGEYAYRPEPQGVS